MTLDFKSRGLKGTLEGERAFGTNRQNVLRLKARGSTIPDGDTN